MANSTDIQYNINLRTTADNSGVDDVKSKIKTIAEEPVVITTEVKTSDDNSAQSDAAKAAAEEAKTIREAEAEALRQNAEEARQIRAEETSERQQTARANKQISDQERREKKAASDESVKLLLKEQATKRALAEASKQATSESSQEDIKAADLARKNLESLEGVRKKQTSQQLADGKQVEGGIADQGKALAWLGSTWTKVAAGMTAAMGVFGLIMQAINGLKSLWDWWNKDAIEAEKKKQEELEKTKEQVTQLKAIVEELQLAERNSAAAKLATERWENERKAIDERNAAIQRGIDMQLREAQAKAQIEGNLIELQRIDLAEKWKDKQIDDVEYAKQDVALREKAAEAQRKAELAAPQAEVNATTANVTAAQGNVQTAEDSYKSIQTKMDGLQIRSSSEFSKFLTDVENSEVKNNEFIERRIKSKQEAEDNGYEWDSSFLMDEIKAYNKSIEQKKEAIEEYKTALTSEGLEAKDKSGWIASAQKLDEVIKSKLQIIEDVTKALGTAEEAQAKATGKLQIAKDIQDTSRLVDNARGSAEVGDVKRRIEQQARAKQEAKDKEEMKKNNDAQMAQYAANIVAGIEAAKTGKSASSTEARTKQLGDASNIESKIAVALKDILGGGDKNIDKQEAQQLDSLLSELQASSAFNTALGRDIMAVINTNLESSIQLQLAEDKTRTDLAAIAAKTNRLYTIVKNIRG